VKWELGQPQVPTEQNQTLQISLPPVSQYQTITNYTQSPLSPMSASIYASITNLDQGYNSHDLATLNSLTEHDITIKNTTNFNNTGHTTPPPPYCEVASPGLLDTSKESGAGSDTCTLVELVPSPPVTSIPNHVEVLLTTLQPFNPVSSHLDTNITGLNNSPMLNNYYTPNSSYNQYSSYYANAIGGPVSRWNS